MCLEEKNKSYPSYLPEDTTKLFLMHHFKFVKATVETAWVKPPRTKKSWLWTLQDECEQQEAKPREQLYLGCHGEFASEENTKWPFQDDILGNGIFLAFILQGQPRMMPGLPSIFLKLYSFFCGLGVQQLHFLLEQGFVTTLGMKPQCPLKTEISSRLVLYLKP